MPRKIQDIRAECDLLTIYENEKLYINEKKYLTNLVEALHKLGFYIENESIYCYTG